MKAKKLVRIALSRNKQCGMQEVMFERGENVPKCLAYVIFAESSWGVIVSALAWMRPAMGDEAYSRAKNTVQDKGLSATMYNIKG